jgi:hypothetical protein
MTLPVMIKMDEAEDHQKAVKTYNVSSSGVYFEFASPLDVGTALEFVLTLPEQITKGSAVRIKCVGKVVRVDQGNSKESLGVAATIERYEFLREV